MPPGHSNSGFNVPSDSERVREISRKLYCTGGRVDDTPLDVDDSDQDRIVDVEGGSDEKSDKDEDQDEISTLEELFENPEKRGQARSILKKIGTAYSDGLKLYNLGTPMNVQFEGDEDLIERLIEADFLKEKEMGNRSKFYELTDKAISVGEVDPHPKSGGELGSESFEHRFGVRLAATYYEQKGFNVNMYHGEDEDSHKSDEVGSLYDIYIEDTKDSDDNLRKIVEVETSPEKGGHVKSDYNDLAEGHGEAVWIVTSLDEAQELVKQMKKKNCIPDDIQHTGVSFKQLNQQLDFEGASKIIGLNELMNEV